MTTLRRPDVATNAVEPSSDSDALAAGFVAPDDVVDIADTATWPVDLHDMLGQIGEFTELEDSVVDLRPPQDADDRVRACLRQRRLLAFHSTRLLDHEREAIKAVGLRMYGRELFDDKINSAYEHGAINCGQRDTLLEGHMCAGNEPMWRGKRENQVCAVLGRSVLTTNHTPYMNC